MSGIIYHPGSPGGQVDWAATPAPAELDADERDRLAYRMSAAVAAGLDGLPGCRVLRSGLGIAIWTGPDRQRHRPPDYVIWTEDQTDQHLHKTIAAEAIRKHQDEPRHD